ncbi:hypothetical protein I4I80_02925 [Pseudomonas syringae pv. tomato]|nr:hypothetical protein [Pseudomonas syringae pv. tomato]MBW8023698.1 hypothetical protein [Pseudomonas syringae pv. tomato]
MNDDNCTNGEKMSQDIEHYKDKVKFACSVTPLAIIPAGIVIMMSATSDAAPGSMMATIDSLGMFTGIAGLCITACFYIALKIRLKLLATEVPTQIEKQD